MATARGYGGNKNYRPARSDSSDDDSPPKTSGANHQKATRKDTADLEETTLDVVDEFKDIVKKKIRQGDQISQSIVESAIATIRCGKNPDQCSLKQWKKDLPRDLENCSDRTLRESMAYGNNPREVKSIIQSKMNNKNSNGNPTDTSFDNILEPLKKLRRELAENSSPNLFLAVQNINERDTDRADRLFYSEAHHFAPGLKDYTFTDAHNAVQAISETKYKSADPKILIPIIKTFREVEDVRDYLEKVSKPSTTRKKSPSRSSDDEDPPSSHTTTTNSLPNKNNNDTSSFHIKPLHDPYSSQSTSSTSRRFNNISQDETTQSLPRRPSERK